MDTSTVWTATVLGKIADLRLGRTPPRDTKRYWHAGTVPWVSIRDLNNGRLSTTREKISAVALDEVFRSDLVSAGTILMSFKLTLGKVAILDVPAVHNEAIVSLALHDHLVDRDFLFYYLQSMDLSAVSDKYVKGSTLNRDKLDRLSIALPTIEVQRAIAGILKCAGDARDCCAEAILHGENLLSASRHALWTSISTAEDLPLGSIAAISTGTTPPTERLDYWSGDVPFVKTTAIADCRIWAADSFVSSLAINDYSMSVHPPGTVLLAMYGQGKTRGRAAILVIPACTSQNAAAIACSEKILPDYLWHDLRRRYHELRQDGIQGHLSHLNLAFVRRFEMKIPSLDEQRRIVEILAAIDAKIDAERRRLAALEDLYRTLLHGLMTGALRVDDPAVARETAQLSLPANPVE